MMESQLLEQAHLIKMEHPETQSDVGPRHRTGPGTDWEADRARELLEQKALEEAFKMDHILLEQAAITSRSRDPRSYLDEERPRRMEQGQSLEDRAYAEAIMSQKALDLQERELKEDLRYHSRESRVQYRE